MIFCASFMMLGQAFVCNISANSLLSSIELKKVWTRFASRWCLFRVLKKCSLCWDCCCLGMPCQDICHMYTKKKGVSSNRDTVYLHWVTGCSVLLPGHQHLLCFTGVQQKVYHWTPSNQFLDLLSVCCHISTADETQFYGVVGKLDNDVGVMEGGGVHLYLHRVNRKRLNKVVHKWKTCGAPPSDRKESVSWWDVGMIVFKPKLSKAFPHDSPATISPLLALNVQNIH